MKRNKKKYNGNTRIEQKKETRNLILESAKIHFEKSGFDRATLRAIASNANVGLGTIFNYFPNKPSLLIATLLDELEKVEDLAFRSLPENDSIIEKCIHITGTYYSYYAKHISLSRTLIKESNFIQGEFGDLLVNRTDNFICRIRDMMISAQKKGEIRKEADCDLAAKTYFSFFIRYLFAGLNAQKFDVEKSLDTIRKLMEQYVKGVG